MTDRTELRRLLDEAPPLPYRDSLGSHGLPSDGPTYVALEAQLEGRWEEVATGSYDRWSGMGIALAAAAVNALPSLLDQLDAADAQAKLDRESRSNLLRELIEAREFGTAKVRELTAKLDAAEAALARVRELHERWPIHGDGDHPEDCDCGDPWVTVCRLCCTDGEDQHETCAAYHDHGPDKPICPTIAAIGGEQS